MNRLQRLDPEFEKLCRELMRIEVANGTQPRNASFPKVTKRIALNSRIVEIIKQEFIKSREGKMKMDTKRLFR